MGILQILQLIQVVPETIAQIIEHYQEMASSGTQMLPADEEKAKALLEVLKLPNWDEVK